MSEEQVERWRPSDPNAKDFLLRHDFDRCLSDLSYRRENAAWYEQAKAEKRRREQEAAQAARVAQAREAFARRHDRAAEESEAREKARRETAEAASREVQERLKRTATL